MNQTYFHRRNLPHYYRPNSTYFITFRLKCSIPQIKLNELRNRKEFTKDFATKEEKYNSYKKFFNEYDKLLDNNSKIEYLRNPQIAEIVQNSLHYLDKKEYKLICYTIMPNHVHLVFHLLEKTNSSQSGLTALQNDEKIVAQRILPERISKIMKSIKGISAREANKILHRNGAFWQGESFDHLVRDEDELERILEYVIYNPVKANLVEKWDDWDFTYLVDNW